MLKHTKYKQTTQDAKADVLVNKLEQGLKLGMLGVLCSAVALTTGCNRTIKAKVHKPTKLVKLEQAINVVNPVFTTSVSSESHIASSQFEVGFDGDKVIVASPSGTVTSFTKSGQKLWSIDLAEEITSGVAYDATSQTAIVSTKSASVIALNTADGSRKWQKKIEGTVLAPAFIYDNRVVLSANDGMMHGLSLQTGESIWQFATQTPSISVRGSAKPTLLDSRTVLLASADGRLHALDIETGIPKWSRRVGIPTGSSEIQRMTDVDGTPTVDAQQLFAVSYSGQLIGVDLQSRQLLFVENAASKNSLAVTHDAVISTTLDGKVNAYDRQTGVLLWQNDALAYRKLSNPVTVGQYIAIGDYDGVVHFLSATDGRIVSREQTKGAVGLLTVQSGYLLTQTASGHVAIWKTPRMAR